MRKISKPILISSLAVVVLIAAGLLNYWNRPSTEVYQARRGKAVAAVYGTVRIEWLWSVTVRAQNAGYIQFAPGIMAGQRSVGMRVKKGQLLASIADEATARELRQAKVDLQAVLDKQRIGPSSAQTLRTARDNLDRLMKLKELNNVPLVQLEQAQNEVKRVQDSVATEQIELDRAVETMTQNFKNLQQKLGKSEIKAPIDGVLTAVQSVDGELVLENAPIFTVAVNNTYVLGEVNEEDVGGLRPDMKAKVKLYSFANQEFDVVLSSILPANDAGANRYSVILNMDNPPSNLMAGMTGEMNIILGERENSLLIPTRALMADRVLVVEKGIVTPRVVKVGYQSLETAEILEGLKEGDWVIVADQDLFAPGQRVRPILVNRAAER
ncbi:MAG: efflux RND transporter periplasmic adaptor subunit [bacterium]